MNEVSTHFGTIFLVGAGPGDPELLTMRAFRLISGAGVIVHDGLVDAAILALAPSDCEFISVAKSRARHTLPQDNINALLIRLAREGRDVVRLKGGDPFIFGRGGEEADDCRAAGVPVECVPGISAAVGAAADALMPLTHRDAASAVTFVAGQCKGLTDQNWAGLAGKGRTLVIYMGVASAEAITEKLIADGLSPDTPIAVMERATRADARYLRTLLTGHGGPDRARKCAKPRFVGHWRCGENGPCGGPVALHRICRTHTQGKRAMKLLTGNDLKTGLVTWWTGQDWSLHIEDAIDVADGGDALIQTEEAAQRVTAAYIIDGSMTDKGPRPAHIKDRVRALGPTVRPDLTLKPNDADALQQVV